MWLSELTLQSLGFRLLALLVLITVQGAVVAGAARLLGDRGPTYDGRLSMAPARHLDLLGGIAFIFLGLGWGKAVDVDPRQLRGGPVSVLLVIGSAVAATLGVAALLDALILPALTGLSHAAGLATAAFLRAASDLAVWFALLNLFPIPPLTGGLLLGAAGLRVSGRATRVLAVLLLIAVASGVARELLAPAHAWLAPVVLRD